MVRVFVSAKFFYSGTFVEVPIWISPPFVAIVLTVPAAASPWKARCQKISPGASR